MSFASWRESVSITSPDVPPGITSSRQRASLPGEASLASYFAVSNPLPATPNPVLMLSLTSHNLELGTDPLLFPASAYLSKRRAALFVERITVKRSTRFSCSFLPRTRNPQPRLFFLPPGEASHASPDGFPEIILVVIVPLFVYKLLPTTNHLPPTTALSPPGAKASASLPRMFLRASLPAQQHHFCILQLIFCSFLPRTGE